MRTIFKYPVSVGDNAVMIPAMSRLLHFGEQDGRLFIWAMVDTIQPDVAHRIYITGTGFDNGILVRALPAPHLGTVVQAGIGLVWHAFDLGYPL